MPATLERKSAAPESQRENAAPSRAPRGDARVAPLFQERPDDIAAPESASPESASTEAAAGEASAAAEPSAPRPDGTPAPEIKSPEQSPPSAEAASTADGTPAQGEASPTAPADAPAPESAGGESEAAAAGEAAPAEPAAAEGSAAGDAVGDSAGDAEDAPLRAVVDRVHATAERAKRHPAAGTKVAEAQAAARAPANDRASRAKVAHVAVVEGASAPKPEPATFLSLLRAKLQEIAPKNLDEMDKFKSSGKASEMKADLSTKVAGQKDAATADLKRKAQVEPDPNSVAPKPVEPLPPGQPEVPPASVHADEAVPPAKRESAVALDASRQEVDNSLAEHDVTDEQLRKANDPRFSAVVAAKEAVQENAETAPAEFRAGEKTATNDARANAARAESVALGGMHGARGHAATGVRGRQDDAQSKDEGARKEVADRIEAIYAEAKLAVQGKLEGLDADVSRLFDEGEAYSRQRMEDHVNARKEAYKAERYSGLGGPARWVYDLFASLPDEVKVFYDEGRDIYLREMDAVIVRVADLVETRLREAKEAVASGRRRIGVYVDGLPASLQRDARAAQAAVTARFDELEHGVDAKRDELVNSIAQRYQEARDKADKRLEEMRDSDRGLVSRFAEALGPVLEILMNFKNRIVALVGEAADTIGLIVADPIGFLGNLLSAVKLGVRQFADNIWAHLKEGFFGWLFGAVASAGITLPKDFSLASIFGLVLQILGITPAFLRKKAVKLIGERNVALIEKVWEFVSALINGGIEGLWEHIKEYLSDLKDTILQSVQEWVVTKIVQAAITKLISMFNPVGAIIQAIITIYNVVEFFIQRINQIMDFVQAIVSSVSKIARGAIADAANWIENAMARAIPVLISFLASLLGLGGISEKVKAIIEKVQAKVDTAVDKAIAKIVGFVGKLFGKGKKDDPAAKQGTGDPEHDAKWTAAVAAVHEEVLRMEADGVTNEGLAEAIPRWKKQFGFQELSVNPTPDGWDLSGSMSPGGKIDTIPMSGGEKNPFEIVYPKPEAKDYPKLYFGGRTSTPILQKNLAKMKKVGGQPVEVYSPVRKKTLPGGDEIGLDKEYRLKEGDVIGPLSKARTPGGKKINAALKPYGFSPADEYLDGDHVQEIQMGGVDDLVNLWPLDASKNRGAGSILAQKTVKFPGKKKTETIANLKADTKHKYYFKLIGFDK